MRKLTFESGVRSEFAVDFQTATISPSPQMLETRLDQEPVIRLWNAAVQGDRAALSDLLRQHQDQIFRFCLSQLHDENLAVDATQETAKRLIQRLNSFDSNARFSTWVLGFALNVCREMRRKSNRNQSLDDCDASQHVDFDEDPGNRLAQQEDRSRLTQALRRLPVRQQRAIILRYFESLSIAEIAKVMGIEIGTVKATLHNALKKLKQLLD
ncbi:MAG: RNA polymerase sigma factor [Planctomycetota bacterium]